MKFNANKFSFLSLIIFLLLITFHFSLYAQVISKAGNKTDLPSSSDGTSSIQATGDAVQIKDDNSNLLFRFIDEGNFGSLQFSSGVPTTGTLFKLYNNNGTLYFNGNAIATNYTITQLSDLSDAKTDVASLFLGSGSGDADTGPDHFNTGIGINSLHNTTTGTNNTAIGGISLYSNTTGKENVAIGVGALQNNSVHDSNTAVGAQALHSFASSSYGHNTALGCYALFNYNPGVGKEGNNTAIGSHSLFSSTTGAFNTAVGHHSLYKNTIGLRNTAIGEEAMLKNIIGTDNVAVGNKSLYSNQADDNAAFGSNSLQANTSGYFNTALGSNSLGNNTGGNENSAVGYGALGNNNTGHYNIGIGNLANAFNETGSNNTMIGWQSGMGTSGLSKSGNIFIGYQSGKNENGSNLLYIDNSSTSSPLIWGDFANDIAAVNGKFGVGTQAPSDKVEIDAAVTEDALRIKVGSATKLRVYANGGTSIGANFAGTPTNGLYVAGDIQNPSGVLHSSDVRFKKNINKITNCLENIKKINGIYYNWKTEEFPDRNFNNEKQIGVIAQEVEKVFPELVSTANDGYKSVNYSKLSPILIEAIKEQENKIQQIEKQNVELKTEIAQMKSALNQIIDFQNQTKLTSK